MSKLKAQEQEKLLEQKTRKETIKVPSPPRGTKIVEEIIGIDPIQAPLQTSNISNGETQPLSPKEVLVSSPSVLVASMHIE